MLIHFGNYHPMRGADGHFEARTPKSILEARNLEEDREAAGIAEQLDCMGRTIEAEILQLDGTSADFCTEKGNVVALGVRLSTFPVAVDVESQEGVATVKPANSHESIFESQRHFYNGSGLQRGIEYKFHPQGSGLSGPICEADYRLTIPDGGSWPTLQVQARP